MKKSQYTFYKHTSKNEGKENCVIVVGVAPNFAVWFLSLCLERDFHCD